MKSLSKQDSHDDDDSMNFNCALTLSNIFLYQINFNIIFTNIYKKGNVSYCRPVRKLQNAKKFSEIVPLKTKNLFSQLNLARDPLLLLIFPALKLGQETALYRTRFSFSCFPWFFGTLTVHPHDYTCTHAPTLN